MTGHAQVRSTPAIEALRAALARFETRVQAALDTLDGELQRTENWLEHDRPAHWRRELRGAEDALHEAKMDLERCLMMTVAGERPACREQKAAVRAAQQRLAYCRDKTEVVKRWQQNFRHESLEYRGRVGQLKRAIEQDLPEARAVLVKILRRLEEYQIERPPEAYFNSGEPSQPVTGSVSRNGNRDGDELPGTEAAGDAPAAPDPAASSDREGA